MIKIKFITIFLILISFSNTWANPKVEVPTAIIMDYNSGKILFEREPDQQIYPASMTKIMTSIVAFDLLKSDKIKLSDEVIVSENAWRMSKSGYSSMFIMLNDKVSVEDILTGEIKTRKNTVTKNTLKIKNTRKKLVKKILRTKASKILE